MVARRDGSTTGRRRTPIVSWERRANRFRALLATFLFCGLPEALHAHAIHSTLTEVVRTADGTISVRIRAFADDLSTAVARHSRRLPRPDLAVADAELASYVSATLQLSANGHAATPLTLVSQRRTGDVVWIELRGRASTLSRAAVRNAMLFEVHADQVNVVKAIYDRTSFTTLFSSGDRAKVLP